MNSSGANLFSAFAYATQANRKFVSYADIAEKEGLHNAVKLFHALAIAKTIHASNHMIQAGRLGESALDVARCSLRQLKIALSHKGRIGTTKDNIKESIEFELDRASNILPERVKVAELEYHEGCANHFRQTLKVVESHAEILKSLLANLSDTPEAEYYVCMVCGYIHAGPCEKCPICGAEAEHFSNIDKHD